MKSNLHIISFLTALLLSLFWTADTEAQLNWEKYENNPVLYGNSGDWDTQCWFPVVIHDEGIFKMWYNGSEWGGDRQIGYATSEDGIEWVKDENNPVIPAGEDGSWDHYRYPGTVLRIDDTLRMWLSGSPDTGPDVAVGYAWFDEEAGEWNLLEDPVLDQGETGTWDDLGVFMPSVYYDGTIYHMYYSGIGGVDGMDVGYATSGNGIDWTKYEDYPVMVHGFPGTFYSQWITSNGLVCYNGALHMFFNGFDASTYDPEWSYFTVGYAWSTDYVTWNIETEGWPVVDVGPQGAWDDRAVRQPYVMVHENRLKMWYAGFQFGSTYKIGYALGDTVITGMPDKYELNNIDVSISPSPFTREALVSYRLAERSTVRIAVYNGSGQVVALLVNDIREPGEHRVVLDGRNLPAGVYFCVLTTPQKTETKKIIKLQ